MRIIVARSRGTDPEEPGQFEVVFGLGGQGLVDVFLAETLAIESDGFLELSAIALSGLLNEAVGQVVESGRLARTHGIRKTEAKIRLGLGEISLLVQGHAAIESHQARVGGAVFGLVEQAQGAGVVLAGQGRVALAHQVVGSGAPGGSQQ